MDSLQFFETDWSVSPSSFMIQCRIAIFFPPIFELIYVSGPCQLECCVWVVEIDYELMMAVSLIYWAVCYDFNVNVTWCCSTWFYLFGFSAVCYYLLWLPVNTLLLLTAAIGDDDWMELRFLVIFFRRLLAWNVTGFVRVVGINVIDSMLFRLTVTVVYSQQLFNRRLSERLSRWMISLFLVLGYLECSITCSCKTFGIYAFNQLVIKTRKANKIRRCIMWNWCR